jgi:hypothetical protein
MLRCEKVFDMLSMNYDTNCYIVNISLCFVFNVSCIVVYLQFISMLMEIVNVKNCKFFHCRSATYKEHQCIVFN